MGTINYGNQIQSIKYYAPADSDVLNRRDVGVKARGIYSGGLLTKVSDVQVTLSTLVCEIGDASNQLRIETQSSVAVTVSTGTPYIVLRWAYAASTTNYMDVLAVAAGSIQDNDLIVGKCVFSGATLTGFDYGERPVVMAMKEFLRVIPTATPSMKVHIKGGWATYGSSKLLVAEQDSSFTITAPVTNPRIDYVYIDESGNVQVEAGTEAASPTVENYQGRIVLAEIYLVPSQTTIVADDITDVRPFIGSSGGGTSGEVVVQVSQTAHGFVVGECLRWNGTQWVKAQANSVTNALAVGMVSAVYDTNSFALTLIGRVSKTGWGLTPGAVYYLSDSVAGGITATEPTTTGLVSKPVFIARTATEGYFFNWRGLEQPFGGGGAGASKEISQSGHGLTVGNVVRFNGTNYVKAQADSATNAEVVGIVSDVADVNTFTVTFVGYVSGLSGLVAGTVYFLSDASAGALTATEPSDDGSVSKPLFIAISTTEGYFINMRGVEITPSTSYFKAFTSADLVSGVLTVQHNFGHKYVIVQVYDDSDQKVDPDVIAPIDSDNVSIDLTSFGSISGTWHAVLLDFGGNTAGSTFISNTDAPTTYLGQRGRVPYVNEDEDGLLFGSGPVRGMTPENLVIKNNASNPAYQIDIDCDAIVIENVLATSINVTVDITVGGANGLDTGVEANDAWYYIWLIYNPSTQTTAGLFSTSTSSPTLPSGYTKKRLVGAVRNDSSGNFLEFYQNGSSIWYNEVLANLVVLSLGTAATWTIVDCRGLVPELIVREMNLFVHALTSGGSPTNVDGYVRPNGLSNITGSVIRLNATGTAGTRELAESIVLLNVDGQVQYQVVGDGSTDQMTIRVNGFTLKLW
jgi:hypothetical protein